MRALLRRVVRRLADSLGADVVERTMYSPVPAVPAPDDPVWSKPRPLLGLELDLEAQFRFVESELTPYLGEFDPPRQEGAPGDFHLWNTWYQGGDAELLYAMVRLLRPRRVLELGSGWSTLVTARACAVNAAHGAPVEFTSSDPEPRLGVDPPPPGLTRLERTAAQELPMERFLALAPGDVLFVDTTHTVKLGSEVNRLVLEVLPRLAPGVTVHFHDIYLPWEYPRFWYKRGTYLNEQDLLQAFLSSNPDWEVLLAVHALARTDRDRLARSIGSLSERVARAGPSAFWIRRRGVSRA
jgi:hypothetical protein